MIKLLRCPEVSIDKISKYLSYTNHYSQYSNFGYCETLLRNKFSKLLSIPLERLCLGSSATALLRISCQAILDKFSGDINNIYFPVFSFLSTFSISALLEREINWFDIDKETFLPIINKEIKNNDLIFLNVPFGESSKIDTFFEYARNHDATFIVDAAACLPGLIYNKKDLKKIPANVIIVFSLHATKLISSGEGGLCIFGKDIPNNIKQLTNFGIDKNRTQKWEKSFNAKMSEYNAAAGLSSLDNFEKNAFKIIQAKEKIKRISTKYNIEVYNDINFPSLIINFCFDDSNEVSKKLIKKNYEFRRGGSLSKYVSKLNHKNSIFLYKKILGVPFDWIKIDSYFDQMCKDITG